MPYYVHLKTIERFAARMDSGELAAGDYWAFLTRVEARENCPPNDWTVTFVADSDEYHVLQTNHRTRLAQGDAYNVPWSCSYPLRNVHLPVLLLSDPGLVYYFQSEEHGIQNRHTSTKPGRYLKQFLTDYLSQDAIDAYVKEITADKCELTIAHTEDEIRKIYNSSSVGFSSCMQRKRSSEYDWQADMDSGYADHPAIVYAGPDLAVAYRGPLERVSQRAVVWPEEKRYQRIYGDGPLLALLVRAGYHNDGLAGARVRKIKHERGGYLMPYVDGIDTCDHDHGNNLYLVLRDDSDGEFQCQNTNGRTCDNEPENEEIDCDHCGGSFSPDDLEYGLCSSCSESQWSCESCGDHYYEDDESYNVGDDTVCHSCYLDVQKRCMADGCRTKWVDVNEFTNDEIKTRDEYRVANLCRSCGDAKIEEIRSEDEDSDNDDTIDGINESETTTND